MSVGAVLGMSAQPGPTVSLSFLSPRAVGHTPIKSECLGRRRWRQVRAIMAGWTAWHTVGQIPSPSRSKSKYRGGSCRSHRPVQSRRLAYVLWRDPHVPRNLLNQQRMTERPDHQRLKLAHYALGLGGCVIPTWYLWQRSINQNLVTPALVPIHSRKHRTTDLFRSLAGKIGGRIVVTSILLDEKTLMSTFIVTKLGLC